MPPGIVLPGSGAPCDSVIICQTDTPVQIGLAAESPGQIAERPSTLPTRVRPVGNTSIEVGQERTYADRDAPYLTADAVTGVSGESVKAGSTAGLVGKSDPGIRTRWAMATAACSSTIEEDDWTESLDLTLKLYEGGRRICCRGGITLKSCTESLVD